MKKVKKFLLLSVILVICCFCSSKKSGFEGNVIYYDDLVEVDAIEYGDPDYFDTCSLIVLETNADALIADITQLEVFEDKIYIWDASAEKLMYFSDKGNFLGTIGKKGRAPHEYGALAGFYMNAWDSTVNLFDPVNMAVKTYGIDGSYIKEVKHKNEDLGFVVKCSMLDSTKIFCYHSTNWKNNNMFSVIDIHDYDHSLEVVEYPYTSSEYFSSVFSNQPYVVAEGQVTYNKLFSNNLYRRKQGQTELCLEIRHKKEIDDRLLGLRLEERKGDYYKVRQDLIRENIYNTGFLNLFENNRFLLADFMTDKSRVKALLWDKKLLKGVRIDNYSNFAPDLKLFKSIHHNTVFAVWDRNSIAAFRENLNEKNRKSYPSEMIEAICNFNMEEDNPMLIVFTFKDEV